LGLIESGVINLTQWVPFVQGRANVVYRGRAVPLLWLVLKHKSASVKLSKYRPLLARAKNLMPVDCKIVLLADRGFICIDLMRYIKTMPNWHSEDSWQKIYEELGSLGGFCQPKISANFGSARFYHNIDKSNGFQLEISLIRSATALNKLGFALAVATLFLTNGSRPKGR